MRSRTQPDGTPRLGLLRWVGPGLIGLLTLAIALSQPPLFEHWPNEGSVTFPMMYPGVFGFWIMLFYSPFLIGLLASLIGAFRAIAAASHRAEFRALMDLGAPRRGLVRHQTRLGLIHGAFAALSGSGLGVAMTQSAAGLGGQFNSTTLWMLLTIVGLTVAATTLAYWVVARWITRGTGRAPSVYDVDAAMGVTSGPAPQSRLRRFAVPLALAAFVVVSAFVTPRLESSSSVPSGLLSAWILAYGLVLGVGLPVLVVWAGARAATWLSGLAGKALLHGGNAARIAGDGLTRPAPARAVAIGAVGLVLGGTLAIGVILNAMGARNEAGATLTPVRVISTAGLPNLNLGTAPAPAIGWEQQGLDPTLVANLQADDRIVVVTADMLTARVASVDPAIVINPHTTTYLAVSAKDLDKVSKGAARALYFDGAVAMGGGANPSVLTIGAASAEVTTPLVAGPFSALPREWAEREFGTGVTSAVLLYDAPGGSVTTAIADYDLTGLHVQDLGGRGASSGPLNRTGVLAVSGTLLMLAVGLVVALSLSVQKTRGHDYATMSALGASRGALRWGTAIESAVVTSAGATMGVVLGAASGLWLAVSGDRVPWSLAWKGITFDIDHAPWGTVTFLALASIAAAAVASVIARARLERLTPTEQLREAIKEGVS
ncbi:FtsX-like permease family protein [Demequina lutea]|uniref:ABC3 transporter permease C-terminal domain-containing protein n=1 Tax=Demequina lutea TaxID=431489 RepID=A0A7Y9Z9U6_9MICO|nr:FtsX-like permease family protein [Demequina lutea]NYI40165.1 hypothetical protein [Demequina lutea]